MVEEDINFFFTVIVIFPNGVTNAIMRHVSGKCLQSYLCHYFRVGLDAAIILVPVSTQVYASGTLKTRCAYPPNKLKHPAITLEHPVCLL